MVDPTAGCYRATQHSGRGMEIHVPVEMLPRNQGHRRDDDYVARDVRNQALRLQRRAGGRLLVVVLYLTSFGTGISRDRKDDNHIFTERMRL